MSEKTREYYKDSKELSWFLAQSRSKMHVDHDQFAHSVRCEDKTDKAPVIDVMKAGYMKARGLVANLRDAAKLLDFGGCRVLFGLVACDSGIWMHLVPMCCRCAEKASCQNSL